MKQLQNKIILVLTIFFLAVEPCFAAVSKELLFTAKKFSLAMIGVAISSILIYVGLTIYNKIFHNSRKNDITTYDENTLEPAKNLDNAISNFLNRTKM